ncbi:MAG: sugar ABC transporter permease [Clostridiaceae bacterium]|nr:sugar ABC transporter permease [Clostridiaceae bacterium]
MDYVGPFNKVLSLLGMERQVFMGSQKLFIPILYFTDVWKEAGWSSIVYLAATTSINPEFYEATEIDGANRLQRIWYITLPCIRSTILILLTLKAGTVLNAGFDQIFNLANPIVQKTSVIIDTYIYRITFQTAGDFSYSTAVSMLKSVINFSLIILLDGISRRIEGVGILARDTKVKGEGV